MTKIVILRDRQKVQTQTWNINKIYKKCMKTYENIRFTCICTCFGCPAPYFGCLVLYFGCLDLYLGVWTCILDVNPPPRGLWSCLRRFFFLLKNDAPGLFEHAYCQIRRFSSIWGPPGIFSKSGQSVQMAMPARRASIFCSRSRSQCPNLFFPDPESWRIPGFCEPWSECQPGETGPQGLGEPPGGVGGTAGPTNMKAFLIRESKNPFRQAWLRKKTIFVRKRRHSSSGRRRPTGRRMSSSVEA